MHNTIYFNFHASSSERDHGCDHNSSSNILLSSLEFKLRLKFSSQQEGKLKWLKGKDNNQLLFIPLEYANDKDYVIKFMSFKKTLSGKPTVDYYSRFIPAHLARIHPSIVQHDTDFKKLRTTVSESIVRESPKSEWIINKVKECGGLGCVDKELVLEYVKYTGIDGGIIQFLSETLRNDYDFLVELVKECPYDFYKTPEDFRNNKDFVLKVVSNNGWMLEEVTDELRDDKDVFECVTRSDLGALYFASERLKNDRSFVFEVFGKIAKEETGLNSMSEREIVLHMVNKNGLSIQLMGEYYQDDIEIVELALKSHCHSLMYASLRIRSDKDFMKRTIEKYCVTFEYAADHLKNDIEIVLSSIYGGGWIPSDFCNDREIVMKATRHSSLQLSRASSELKSDKSFMMEVFSQCSEPLLKYAENSLRSNREFVLDALKANQNNALDLSPPELADREFEIVVAEMTGFTMKFSTTLYNARMEFIYNGACCGLGHFNNVL